jgi:nitrous oxidase accessory protein
MTRWIAATTLPFFWLTPRAAAQSAGGELHVGEGQRFTTVTAAVTAAPAGSRIVIHAGHYREPEIVIRNTVTIRGEGTPVLDGQGQHGVLIVEANDVSISGLHLINTGISQLEERAGIKVRNASGCRIHNNRFEETLFGVYLEKTSGCQVTSNVLLGAGLGQMSAGNGIHAWNSDHVTLRGNRVAGHRDGIYFEFVKQGVVEDNVSERSARYGMHFMFSDDCRYEGNTYRRNGNGVAVMYSRQVTMRGNTFIANQGSAAYGLLLKDINESEIAGNRFIDNTVGLYLEDAGRNRVARNEFTGNGWALKLLASAQGNQFQGNRFVRNAFDVATNSRGSYSTFSGNYWDRYRGYDLDRDGIGDVPHHPVRLFSLIVEQAPAALVLSRSLLVDLLDLAEKAFPAITPEAVRDDRPLLRDPATGGTA